MAAAAYTFTHRREMLDLVPPSAATPLAKQVTKHVVAHVATRAVAAGVATLRAPWGRYSASKGRSRLLLPAWLMTLIFAVVISGSCCLTGVLPASSPVVPPVARRDAALRFAPQRSKAPSMEAVTDNASAKLEGVAPNPKPFRWGIFGHKRVKSL